jgi:hypothetical protein
MSMGSGKMTLFQPKQIDNRTKSLKKT